MLITWSFSLISYYKFIFRDEPLLPADFMLVSEALKSGEKVRVKQAFITGLSNLYRNTMIERVIEHESL